MNKVHFDAFFDHIIDEIKLTRDDGQKEYAKTETNIFANFDRVATCLQISKEKALMVYLLKHIDWIGAHINGHTSQREHVSGRIKDAIVYLMLLWAMVDGENQLTNLKE